MDIKMVKFLRLLTCHVVFNLFKFKPRSYLQDLSKLINCFQILSLFSWALLYNGVFNTYDYLSSVTAKNVSSTSQKKYIYIYIKNESERGKREEEGEDRCTSLILGFNLRQKYTFGPYI
jgi:hypothetical protein